MWKPYPEAHKIEGIFVPGDPTVPKTRWWNHLYLVWFGWKTVVAFRVHRADREEGYRIGFKASDGTAMYQTDIMYHRLFAMKIGREDCTFFAFSPKGFEVCLFPEIRTKKSSHLVSDIPIF